MGRMGRVIKGPFRPSVQYTYGMAKTNREEAAMTEQISNSEALDTALTTASMGFTLEAMTWLQEHGFTVRLSARQSATAEPQYNWLAEVYMDDPEAEPLTGVWLFYGSRFAEDAQEALVLSIKEARGPRK